MNLSAVRPAAAVGGTASSPRAENVANYPEVGLAAEVIACRCGREHQPRERKVPCRRCGALTDDIHAICPSCQMPP